MVICRFSFFLIPPSKFSFPSPPSPPPPYEIRPSKIVHLYLTAFPLSDLDETSEPFRGFRFILGWKFVYFHFFFQNSPYEIHTLKIFPYNLDETSYMEIYRFSFFFLEIPLPKYPPLTKFALRKIFHYI